MNRVTVASLPAVQVSLEAADAVRGLGSVAGLPATDQVALADLGLVGEDGQLTPAGRRLRDDLRGAPVVLLYEAWPDHPTRRARLYVGSRQMLYVGVPPSAAERAASELLVFPADAVPIVLAGWGRLQPMLQTRADQHGPIEREELWRRCTTSTAPPPAHADDTLIDMWARPWRVWGAQCDQREISLAYVDIEDYGTYIVRPASQEGFVRLGARPSSLLWGDLQGVLRPLCRHHDIDW